MENQNELSDKQGTEVTPVTPSTDGVANVTPVASSPDVQVEKLQKLELELQKRDEDINKLKSSLQRNQEQERKQWIAEKQKLQDEINSIKVSSMTDEQKKQFERERELEEAQTWKQKATQYERALEETQAATNYIEYFKSVGVPHDKLVLNQGLDNLVNSGWAGLQEVMTAREARIKELEAKMITPDAPQAQPVTPQRTPITTYTNSPAPFMSWKDVADKYGNGSLDAVYTKIERGELPPSVLPGG